MTSCISVRNLRKQYGRKQVLKGMSFDIDSGRVLGLIGPNGAGKTTLIKALLGLTRCEGELTVSGLDPWRQRDQLMQEISFIADVAILPGWLSVRNAISFVEGVHPRFQRDKAERYLAKTKLAPELLVSEMSKGMVAQLHLALVMAIDAKLLVLDEPTLGLDILYRKQFYQDLLEEYFDQQKTILISTHQVEEIEQILTDVMLIRDGQMVLQQDLEGLHERFVEVTVNPDSIAQARLLKPVAERSLFGQQRMMFDSVPTTELAQLGTLHRATLSDIYVALMQGDQP
ncbi:MAG: ABC transporter ATP-binding protein [Undibacterium curvum]|uniref:ABC transporter ATP-binding protein n=1 Tax=Undibacterium curvum TaxID=2762294 RepID=UPI003BC25D4F